MRDLLTQLNINSFLLIPVELVIAFSCAILVIYLKNKLFSWLIEQFEATNNIWDESIIQAIVWPSTIAILFGLILYTIEILSPLLPDKNEYVTILSDIRTVGSLIIFASFLIQLVKSIEYNYFKMIDKDSTLESASSYILGKIIKLIIITITIFTILKTQRQDFLALLTVGGAGSLIIGLAAKDMLSNFFGGLTIYLDKPFKVGDMVVTYDHELEGVVEKIGWRSTRIRTLEKRPVSVPNNIWSNIPVENASRISSHRINQVISLRYQDATKIKDIVQDIKNTINNLPGIDNSQLNIVQLNEFGSYSLNILINIYMKVMDRPTFLNIKQDVLFKIIEIVHSHQADFAVPTTNLNVSDKIISTINNSKT